MAVTHIDLIFLSFILSLIAPSNRKHVCVVNGIGEHAEELALIHARRFDCESIHLKNGKRKP